MVRGVVGAANSASSFAEDKVEYGGVRRDHVAETVVQALHTPEAVGRTVEVFSAELHKAAAQVEWFESRPGWVRASAGSGDNWLGRPRAYVAGWQGARFEVPRCGVFSLTSTDEDDVGGGPGCSNADRRPPGGRSPRGGVVGSGSAGARWMK